MILVWHNKSMSLRIREMLLAASNFFQEASIPRPMFLQLQSLSRSCVSRQKTRDMVIWENTFAIFVVHFPVSYTIKSDQRWHEPILYAF